MSKRNRLFWISSLSMIILIVVAGILARFILIDSNLSINQIIIIHGLLVLIPAAIVFALINREINRKHAEIMKTKAALRANNTDLERRVGEKTIRLKETIDLLNETARISNLGGWEYDVLAKKLSFTNRSSVILNLDWDIQPTLEGFMDLFLVRDGHNPFSDALNKAISLDQDFDTEWEIKSIDGSRKWVRITCKSVQSDGQCLKVSGTIREITQRKLAELKLKEHEEFLQDILDNLPLNVYVKDTESRKILINKKELEAIGLSNADEVLGKDDYELFDNASATISRDEDLKVLNGETILNKETELILKDGSRIPYYSSKIPLKNKDGKIDKILGISYDRKLVD